MKKMLQIRLSKALVEFLYWKKYDVIYLLHEHFYRLVDPFRPQQIPTIHSAGGDFNLNLSLLCAS